MAKAQAHDHSPRSLKGSAKGKIPNGRVKHTKLSRPNKEKLHLHPRPDWHAVDLPPISTPSILRPVSPQLLENVHTFAKSLFETEASNYTATHLQASSSYKFMSTIMSSGTWSDKISALTLVVQESPLHALKPFENLVALAGKRSRTQALLALEALKDMMSQGNVLPPHRKLRSFAKQPELLAALQDVRSTWSSEESLPSSLTLQHLIFWAYEDHLKAKYFDILKILESWCNDEVEFSRLRSVTFVSELLKEKPEQEENLLRLLVNKLGDTSKKVASRASYLLLQIQITHPSMKSIIINAIESDILLRPGQNLNAKYYAVITLNQTVLQSSDPAVANKLLDVYFGLFAAILNRSKMPSNPVEQVQEEPAKKRKRKSRQEAKDLGGPEQELQEKLVAQVLAGVNRAFPFSEKDSGAFEKHLDTMFSITHSSNFNTSIQALMLIQQISATHNISTDRFLRTLYESLLDPRLVRSSKHTMYLNLLYRSLKSDVSVRRIKAFIKRLLQIMELHEPPFVCALLYLVIELQNIFPGAKAMLDQPEADDEDEEEAFADVLDEDDVARAADAETSNSQRNSTIKPPPFARPAYAYDGRKRDPEHSNADKTCLWELSPWTRHYHPSVTVFAAYLASRTLRAHSASSKSAHRTANAPTKPDPTAHSLIHFLDRFVYRNPRSRPDNSGGAALRGTSLMQPALAANTTDSLLVKSSVGARDAMGMGAGVSTSQPLNTESFWSKRVEDVAPDEVFFHRYFAEVGPKRKAAAAAAKSKEDGEAGADGGSEDAGDGGGEFGEDDEDEIWKALVGSSGGEGLDDDDDDDDEESDDAEGGDGDDVDDDEMFDYDDEEEDEDVADVDVEGGLSDLDVGDVDGGEAVADPGEKEEEEDDDAAFDLEDDDSSALFSSEDEEGGEAENKSVLSLLKDARGDGEAGNKRNKRRKLKDLPTFASAEDYAELIAGGEGDADEEG